MNNLLIAIAVFVITVLAALFAVPHFIDWNSYRSAFEEEARNVLGREVQVDGDVKLYLLPTPYFRVEKVRIADTSAGLSEHFFKTESLSIKLSAAPLLRGVVEANEIELQRPVLRLALDANGGWNWQGFAQALGSTGYVPANVTLTSVRVVEGVIALHDAEGVERARIDGVSGELSAPSLEGPYRFRGTFTSGGAPREIRIATGAPEADRKVPFRISLRLLDTGASYVLDARAVDLMGKARIEGDLTARLPVAANAPGGAFQRVSAGSEEEPRVDRGETPLEIKAAVRADVAGAAFSDLTLTFEQGDRPQLVTGTAKAAWRNPVAVEMDLTSRWLDLDLLAGTGPGSGSVASVAKLAAWIRDVLPGDGSARLSIAVDQANLAGEAIGPLRLALVRSGGKLDITDLRAALPGGGRGELKGGLSAGAGGTPVFRGTLGVRGTSAVRFLSWVTGNGVSIAPEADGPFDVRAGVAVDGGQATLRDLNGTLSGTLLKGGGRYKWTGRPELVVALEGPKLDARGLLPADLSLFDLFGMLTGAAEDAQRTGAGKVAWRSLQTDLDVRVSAGQLVTAARTYRDFSTAVVLKGGNLKQVLLRLSGDDGYNLQLEGKVDNLATQPKGTVRGFVAAETSDSVAPLAALLGIPAAFRPGDSRGQAMVPLRLAGTLTFGSRSTTSADWMVDGEANGAVIKASARFDGGPGGWRSGPADISASVDAADPSKLAALLFPGSGPTSATPARPGSVKPGRVLIRAGGVPADGLSAVAAVDAADVALNYRGRVVVAEGGAMADGALEARAGNGTTLAALAGLGPAMRADGVPVAARLQLAANAGSVTMEKLALQIGDRRLSGRIAVSSAPGAAASDRRRIDAELDTDEISLAMLLSPLLDRRFGAASAAEAVLFGQPSPWPDEPFSASMLDAFEGRIRLASKRLSLADGLSVDRAKVDVVLQPGKVEAKEITGSALGGQVKASVTIEKAPAGADVRGKLQLGIALDEIPGPRVPRASGPMNVAIAFAGRGLTPRAVVSALQGEGSVSFGEARLPRLWPGAIPAAAAAALKADKAEAGELVPALRKALAAGLAGGSLQIANTTFAVEIADGQARSKALIVDTGDGRASGSARLDLKTLKLDSQWRLEARDPSGGKPLPAVLVSYRGNLAALAAAETQIDSAALEQELSARKIEQDMEELERLRRANEAGKAVEPLEPVQRPPGLPPIAPAVREPRPGAPG